ncbi:MAG: protoporphyrinogen oxidase HemJ [SAR324 cluster bacterium]|nr:protoporphyrinogen oxidase HemJ [SAR324 cluster bacterium]
MSYELLKTVHLISIISWFAGLFYMPRLFVYHCTTTDEVGNERFKIMERRLYRAIMMPAMILTVVSGAALWMTIGYGRESGWLHAKASLVFILVIFHFACGLYAKAFAKDQNQKPEVFFRVFNEVPTVILIAVIVLVVYRPF